MGHATVRPSRSQPDSTLATPGQPTRQPNMTPSAARRAPLRCGRRNGIVEREIGHCVRLLVVLTPLVTDRPAFELGEQRLGARRKRPYRGMLDLPSTGELLDDEHRVEHEVDLAR